MVRSKLSYIADQIDDDMLVLDGIYERVRSLPLIYSDDKVDNNFADVLRVNADKLEMIQERIKQNMRKLEIGA